MRRKIKLDDICDFINGGAWSDKEYTHEGIPVLKVSNFKPNGFEIDNVSYLPVDALATYEKNLLAVGDLVIATVGSHPNLTNSAAGRSCIIPKSISGYLLNQNAVCVRSKDEAVLSQKYLCYLGQTHEFKHYIQSRGKGAANQMRIAIGAIKDYEVVLPILPIQCHIAEILSAYDDLIENNQKQIKLLEEAAMLLYKEWFVKLRFPGHENVKIVDGLPEGWRSCHLSEVARVNTTTIPRNYPHLNINYVDIGSVRAGNIDIKTEYTLASAPGRAKRIAKDGDIIWGMVRPNLQAYALVLEPMPNDIFSTGFSVITADSVPFSFIYCVVIQDAFVGYLVNCTNGAAYPAVKPIHFEDAKIIVPTEDLLTIFNEKTEPIYRRAHILRQQIAQAKIARDKLLPKLMNGEIEVL